MTSPAQSQEAKKFYAETISPFLEKSGMGLKEFSRRVKVGVRPLRQIGDGSRHPTGKEQDLIIDFIYNYWYPKNTMAPIKEMDYTQEITHMQETTSSPDTQENLMDIPTTALRDLLRKFMNAEKLSQHTAAEMISEYNHEKFTQATVSAFLRGSNPTKNTLDKIREFLQSEKVLSRFGLPTDLGEPVKSEKKEEEPKEEDEQFLEGIGYKRTEPDPVCAQSDSKIPVRIKARIIAAIAYDTVMTNEEKESALLSLFPQCFQ